MRAAWMGAVVGLLSLTASAARADDPDIGAGREAVCCGFTCCLIDGMCRSTGDLNPLDECEVCDPARSQAAWSAVAGCRVDAGSPMPDGGTACVSSIRCVDNSDCSAGLRCNTALALPACQQIGCGAFGSVCSEGGLCQTGLMCIGGECGSSAADPDAGARDAGATRDGGIVGQDAAAQRDDAGTESPGSRSGCGCRASRDGSLGWVPGLVLVATWIVRRRRR